MSLSLFLSPRFCFSLFLSVATCVFFLCRSISPGLYPHWVSLHFCVCLPGTLSPCVFLSLSGSLFSPSLFLSVFLSLSPPFSLLFDLVQPVVEQFPATCQAFTPWVSRERQGVGGQRQVGPLPEGGQFRAKVGGTPPTSPEPGWLTPLHHRLVSGCVRMMATPVGAEPRAGGEGNFSTPGWGGGSPGSTQKLGIWLPSPHPALPRVEQLYKTRCF